MTLTSHQIVHHLDALHATEAVVFARAEPGRYRRVDAVHPAGSAEVTVDDEPLVAAAVRDGLRRTASPDRRRIIAGYDARSAALVSVDGGAHLVILGRRDGCLAGVSDEELIAAAHELVTASR